MKFIKIPVFIILFCASLSGFSQSKVNSTINVNTDIDRVKVYEAYVKDGYGTPEIYKELANAYYFNNDFEKSKYWFKKLFEVTTITDKQLLFRYNQTLKALGEQLPKNEKLNAVSTN